MSIKLQANKLKVYALVLSLTAVTLFGQTSGQGRIAGQVTDATGAAIPGAQVRVKNEKTGEARTATANESGQYFVNNLAPASYAVTSESTGLGPAQLSVTVSAGQERLLNITLEPAAVSQTINIESGELGQIDTSSARVGANVNEREVGTLPLNGRQLSQLYLMAPGAVTAGGGSYDNIRFSGRANQENAIRVDGVDFSSVIDASPGNLNGETSSGFRLQTSLENVQEFRVDSSNYPAEYGTGTGGQITVVTKSGGNVLHGGIFEYVRNDVFDARNFFDKGSVSPLRVNQFGASAGGPIIKDKFFIFGSYEGLRQVGYQNIIEAVPSASARTRAVASIAPLMQLYPQGTPTSNPDLDLAQRVFRAPINENAGSVRLDYRATDKVSASLRYMRDQGELQSPLNVTGNFSRVTALAHNIALSVSQVLSPTMINETRFGYNGPKTRINGVQPSVPGLNTDLSAVSIDFSGSATITGIGGQGASGGASRIGGLIRSNSSQNGRAQPYTNYSLTFSDTLSVIRGSHQLKFGMEIRPIRIYTDRLGGTTYTYSNVAALLANTPATVQVLGDVSAPNPLHNGATGNRFLKQSYYIGFVQDEWKLAPNLTINYGLRYEYYSPLHEARNLYTYFDMNSGTLDLGSGRDWYASSKYNFGPRLGISWAPSRFNNKTVLRIGAGYNYGPGQTEDQVQTIDSDRVTVTRTSGVAFPVNSQAIINTFDLNNLSGFQPRVYMPSYRLPEK
ncbi:MAG: TonB-dependent receptor, partial [Acidobacteria bacterium]|nr:TonB-dependent receptor [Acidobacteriota bacterium]